MSDEPQLKWLAQLSAVTGRLTMLQELDTSQKQLWPPIPLKSWLNVYTQHSYVGANKLINLFCISGSSADVVLRAKVHPDRL